MIRVLVYHETGQDKTLLSEIEITRLGGNLDEAEVADYSARVIVDRGGDSIVGAYQVTGERVHRKIYNVLFLINKILLQLNEEQMCLEKGVSILKSEVAKLDEPYIHIYSD